MRIFLYEFITGGGMLAAAEPPAESLLREGSAMLSALAADFAAVEGIEVHVLRDRRLPPPDVPDVRVVEVMTSNDEQAAFWKLAAAADWTVVVAPEFGGALLDRCQRVEAAGGRLLGPSPELVQWASDKQATSDRLRSRGIPMPHGVLLEPNQPMPAAGFPCPAVLKPRVGAGSIGVRLVENLDHAPQPVPWPARLESYCPGAPASISVLGGTAGPIVLPACRQRLSDDGRFTYLGGALPLPPDMAARARRLAHRVIDTLPSFIGYLGIDLILGLKSGDKDYVIEINPRLTTSFVGLRAATKQNLANAMLKLAAGEMLRLSFETGAIEFDISRPPRTVAGGRFTALLVDQE